MLERLATTGARPALSEFVNDPIKWFGTRGVRRVIQVRRDDGGDSPAPPPRGEGDNLFSVPIEPIGGERSGIAYNLRSVEPIDRLLVTVDRTTLVDVFTAPAAVHLDLLLGVPGVKPTETPAWMLLPYVHRFDVDLVKKFQFDVSRVLGITPRSEPARRTFTKRLLRALSDPAARKQLKLCYTVFETGRNETSLSLYCGPPDGYGVDRWQVRGDAVVDRWDVLLHSRLREALRVVPNDDAVRRVPGWLCTGDANLSARWTRTPWLARYQPLLPQVGVFVLPHHGSDGSICDEVLDVVGRAMYVACAKRGSEVHPHRNVVAKLAARGYGLLHVSDSEDSTIGMQVEWH